MIQRGQQESVFSTTNLRRGKLTIYVGAAPGVGKTYKMLQDANDWRDKGVDVVVGLIETHGRDETAKQLKNLEVLPKREVAWEGHVYEEMDVMGIIRRRPTVVLIDELAHSNVPGCERIKRFQDIVDILDHGIDVVTAVNIQHLESLHDKVVHITGVKVRERVPDWFMDLADEVKLIDVSPETLQQRLVEGKIYTRDKIEQALTNFFQIGNLSALRELALLEVADDVDQRLDEARDEENRRRFQTLRVVEDSSERILVCVNYRPHSEKLIRRGWRIADRLKAHLFVLVVLTAEILNEQEQKDLDRMRSLSEEFQATFITRKGMNPNIGSTIVAVAAELGVSQIVIGQPLEVRNWWERWRPNPVDYVLDHAEFVDLHVVSNSREG